MSRTLCSIDTIRNIRPIPNADNIEVGTVRGWNVVVRKGEFRDGEAVLYIEPDAALPVDKPIFEFLKPRGTINVDGRDFHVLRTAKLRGQISQGLVLPLEDSPHLAAYALGANLDEALEVFVYEKPVPMSQSNIAGPWPFFWLPKTDSERVQNIPDEWFVKESNDGFDYDWYASEKIDGMSTTYVREGNRLRICSRNFELKTDDPNALQVRVANDIHLLGVMRDHKLDAVQGEVYGEGIQANRLGVKGQHLRLFDAWRRTEGGVKNMFYALHMSGLLRNISVPFFPALGVPTSSEEALDWVTGLKSSVNPDKQAEGIVWHHDYGRTFDPLGGRSTFKAINPSYLIKHNIWKGNSMNNTKSIVVKADEVKRGDVLNVAGQTKVVDRVTRNMWDESLIVLKGAEYPPQNPDAELVVEREVPLEEVVTHAYIKARFPEWMEGSVSAACEEITPSMRKALIEAGVIEE